MINIWEYTDKSNDPILIQYQKWCIEVAKQKWQPQFINFDYVIRNLEERNKKFYDFGKISPADRDVIYRIIYKWLLNKILFVIFLVS